MILKWYHGTKLSFMSFNGLFLTSLPRFKAQSKTVWRENVNKDLYNFQERRECFKEELAEYALQLDEFQNLGDVMQLHDYLRKARSLHDALDKAAACIDHINKEEEALSWPTTHYPTRKQVLGSWNAF